MALTKITRGVIKANENYDTHNINSTGIVTAVTFTGNITGVAATFTGDVSIGGTLTYQDVANIDSVGIITARNGINISGGNINVGTGVTIESNGQSTFTGIVTASSFRGDGSQLTGISVDSTKIETGNTKVETIDTGSDGHVKITTEGTERFRIDSTGRVMLGTVTPGPTAGEHLTIADSANAGITIRSGTTAAGTILFEDDTADRGEIQYSHNGDYMRFKTAGSERVRIDSAGKSTFYGAVETNGSSNAFLLAGASSTPTIGAGIHKPADDTLATVTASTERLRIDSAGRVLIGRTTSLNDNISGTGYANKVQIEGNGTGQGLVVSNTGGIARINIIRKYTASNGDDLAYISLGADPNTSIERARIACQAEFTNANTRGGNLKFYTCGDGAYIPTERFRITSNGDIGIGNVNPGNSFPNGKAIAIGDNDTGIRQNGDGILELWANNAQCFRVRNTGNLSYQTLSPGADNSVDLGTSSLRWRNIYTADLQMSNEGSTNDVDGTWGKYTIQEGENDLFLINRRNGKKYKFNLTEVG